MAWSGNSTPSNSAFSRLRNVRDPDLSSSEECLVYTPAPGGGNNGGGTAHSFVPHSVTTSPGRPSNHQANIAHSSPSPLPSGWYILEFPLLYKVVVLNTSVSIGSEVIASSHIR